LLVAASCLLLAPATFAAEIKNLLVLYSNNRLVPGNVAVDRGIRSIMTSSPDRPVEIFNEFLDWPHFGGEAYEATMSRYLRDKYAARPPTAIIAVNDNALDFLVRNRAQLFPAIPVILTVVSKSYLQSIPTLPSDVVGVPAEYDFSGTIEQALRWHPDTRRLFVVTGASERDRGWEARLRREVPAIAGSVPVEFLAGLPSESVLRRLGELGTDGLVFTPGYFEDGAGRLFNPRDAANLMAATATAPIYGPFDTSSAPGVVGGRVPSFEPWSASSGDR